ncbi:MAG: methylated-DNA--[protein]-cysteine S-methyltransferase [Pseudomonadota bacterium]
MALAPAWERRNSSPRKHESGESPAAELHGASGLWEFGEMRYRHHDTPIGPLLLAGRDALARISFPTGDRSMEPEDAWERDEAAFATAGEALDAYFAGEPDPFDAVATELIGTPFQREVWHALRTVPYGTTTSYGAIAASIGRPKAVRAVGAANGANPIPIIYPCHRVIGSDGRLTGFGGGLPLKVRLLQLECAGGGRELDREARAQHSAAQPLLL